MSTRPLKIKAIDAALTAGVKIDKWSGCAASTA
jgi:hypothetical protein